MGSAAGDGTTDRSPSAAKTFAASAVGTFLVIAGAAAAVLLPAREWREDRSAFDPATGTFGEVRGEVGPECPPVDHDEISCQVLGPDQWLWWQADAKVPVHYPSGRTLPPSPGTRCTHTLGDADRLGIVCLDDSGQPGAWLEEHDGWTRVSDTGALSAFVTKGAKLASTPAGLVVADQNTLHVWRPGQKVSLHRAPHAEQKIYGLTSGPGAFVHVASTVHAVHPGRAALRVVGAVVFLGAAFLLRTVRRGQPRRAPVIAGVLLALVVLGALYVIGALTIIGLAGGLH